MKKNIVPVVLFIIIIPAFFFFSIKLQSSLEKDLVKRFTEQKLLVARQVSNSIEKYFYSIKRNVELTNALSKKGWIGTSSYEEYLNFISGYFKKFKSVVFVFTVQNGNVVLNRINPVNSDLDEEFLKKNVRQSMNGGKDFFHNFYTAGNRYMIILPDFRNGNRKEVNNDSFLSGCIVDMSMIAEMFGDPLKESRRSYAWILDSFGNLVYHPFHTEMQGRNIINHDDSCYECHLNRFSAEKNILEGGEGYSRYRIEGEEEKLVIFNSITIGLESENDLPEKIGSIVISVPYSDVTLYVTKINNRIILLSVVSIILIISFAVYIIAINAKRVKSDEESRWSRHVIETKNRLETLFDGITDGICIIDNEYRVITMNRSMKQLMSVGSDIYEGHYCYDLFCDSKEICKKCPVRDTLERGKPCQIERELRQGNGEKRYWQIFTFPIRNADGVVNQVIKYVKDFTDSKKINDELELSKRLSAMGQMIAGVAHEIKNPLQNISMGISLIKYDLDENSEGAKTLGGVVDGVKKLNSIVSDLLDFSRPLKIETYDYDVNEIIESVIDEFNAEFSSNRVVVRKSFLNKGNSNINIDAFKIKQVFYNLFQNALESMPEGGSIWVQSETVFDRSNKKVIIKLRDSGSGIREENISQVFDPFFTTKSKGVGLGMAIVKRIIELHKGMISVESTEGRGTEFVIVLIDALNEENSIPITGVKK